MSRVKLAALPIHPLLLAAYPVVFLFATNAADQVTLDPLWGPLAIAVGGAAVVLALFTLALRDWHRAALLTTVLVAGFFGYGHAWNAASQFLDSQWPLIGAWALLVGIGLFVAWRSAGWAPTASRALNLIAAVALLLNAWSVAGAMVAFGAVDPPRHDLTELELAPSDPEDLPDVYYIILDRYAGSTGAGGHLRLRQRAVPHGPRGARLQRRAPRPRQLHQDAALARQLAEHGLPGRRCAEGARPPRARIASRSIGSCATTSWCRRR